MYVNPAERRHERGNLRFTRITVFNAVDRWRYEELLDAQRKAVAASEAFGDLNPGVLIITSIPLIAARTGARAAVADLNRREHDHQIDVADDEEWYSTGAKSHPWIS